MRREGRQALLNALLVADIHQHAAEHAQLAVVGAGYEQAAHRHQREKSQRFEGDGLAARVGSRDDEGVELAAQTDIDGHDSVLGYQRMTRLTDVDDAPVVEHGTRRAHFIRQIRLGEYQAQLREVLIAADDAVRELARVGGKLKEDALDLLLLFPLEDADIIVRLHDAHRLDKDRLTARRAVVHQSGDVVAALGLDGHDVPAVALGDDGVLKIFDVLGAVDDLIQHLARLGRRGADFAADVGQRGTRLIRDLILADDRRGDALL